MCAADTIINDDVVIDCYHYFIYYMSWRELALELAPELGWGGYDTGYCWFLFCIGLESMMQPESKAASFFGHFIVEIIDDIWLIVL